MGTTPASVALLRPVLGLVFLVVGAALLAPRTFRVSSRGLWILMGAGGLLTAAFQVGYQLAVDSVGVPTTVALLYLAPALVVAASGPLLGEWPTRARVGLAAVSVVGVWLTVTGARGADVSLEPAGLAWGALAGTMYAGYTLLGRYASPRFGSLATVIYSTAGACIILAVVLPLVQAGALLPPSPGAWGLLALFGLLTMALATFLFYDGLGRVDAGWASITTTVEPVVAALLATWLVDQRLTASGWVGLGLVVTGVAGAYRARRRERAAEAGGLGPG
jgi:DME family drug/metabolite transporter